MLGSYSLDPHPKANFAKECFALIYAPQLKRGRIPANNVTLMPNLAEARLGANRTKDIYAAKVVGPARSSEGVELFYILEIFKR